MAALIATTAEVAADPQVRALGLLRPVEHPAGEFEVIGSPFHLWPAGEEIAAVAPAPVPAFGAAGADTRSVLRSELGLSEERIDALVASGAVTEGGD